MRHYFNYHLGREFYALSQGKKINFFLDLLSVCKGFYSTRTIYLEIQEFVHNGRFTDYLLTELTDFIRKMGDQLDDPYFIIFYDGVSEEGKWLQNSFYPEYKGSPRLSEKLLPEKTLLEKIKKYYFKKLYELEQFENVKIFYLSQYESDFIPHYLIQKNYYESASDQILNVILSVDKDLLQTLKFTNTIMCTLTYKGGKRLLGVYQRNTAPGYLLPAYPPYLKADHIPMLLALAGDRSDRIPGIRGIGLKRAAELIIKYQLPSTLEDLIVQFSRLPPVLQNNFDLIKRNYRLIDFDEQIKRLPFNFEEKFFGRCE